MSGAVHFALAPFVFLVHISIYNFVYIADVTTVLNERASVVVDTH